MLTEKSRSAVARLGEAGIGFSIVSSRPPFGLRTLVEQLDLRLPLGAYNGGVLVMPDLAVVEERVLPHDAALDALAVLRAFGIDVWLFAANHWLLANPNAP